MTPALGQQVYARRTIPDLLDRSLTFGSERAVLFELESRTELTSGAFLERVAGTAEALLERFRPGDRIGVMAGNSASYFILRYALATAGLTEVALNTSHRGDVLRHMLDLAEPAAVIIEDRFAPNLDTAGASGLMRIAKDELQALTARTLAWAGRPKVEIGPADPARILFTSGTTGRSKAVELSHAYEVHTGERHNGLIGIGPEDRWLYATPLFHIDAIYIASILFHTGGAMVIAPDFSVSRFWQDVEVSRATYFSHLGATLGLLLKGSDPEGGTSLRMAVGGGASEVQIAEVERRFGFHVLEAFAMTECIACTINRCGDRRLGTAGRAIDGYEVAVTDSTGHPVPHGETGEIMVRSSEPGALFTRYLGDPDATAEALRNGWFHTGDLGKLDEDGFLTYRGRLKDAIRVKGENVSAMELEAIAELHPQVARSAAVATVSDIADEDILLYIEPAGEAPGPQEVRDFIAERAARFMVPRHVALVEKLPLTATGKVDKSNLPRDPAGALEALPRSNGTIAPT